MIILTRTQTLRQDPLHVQSVRLEGTLVLSRAPGSEKKFPEMCGQGTGRRLQCLSLKRLRGEACQLQTDVSHCGPIGPPHYLKAPAKVKKYMYLFIILY